MSSNNSNEKLGQDPDYCAPLENNKNQQQDVHENNARSTAEKISKILDTEFSKEIEAKKKEIFKIYETLHKACKVFHYLRFAIVTDYYHKENAFIDDGQPTQQYRLHPTVNAITKQVNLVVDCKNDCFQEAEEGYKPKRKLESESTRLESSEPKQKIIKPISFETSYTRNRKIKMRLVIGNYSKWIPPDCREGNDATHRWTVYVIDSQKSDLGNYLSKVRFFLHPSYQPNNVIDLTSSPFYLSRLGWGEFPIRVQLHFKNKRNKPADVIHNLTLDRTYTGLLTIGSETVVDVWIYISEKFLPLIDDGNDRNDVSCQDKSNDPNVPLPVQEEKDETAPIKIKEEKFDANFVEQDKQTSCPDIITILCDHDYIKTNFAPRTSGNNNEVLENSSINLQKKNQTSLLKSSYENTSCTITVNKGKIFSSNRDHNFDELPMSADFKTKVVKITQNFNTEQFYTDPKNYAPDKEHFKEIIRLIERAKPKNLSSVLKLVIHKIPLITEKSRDPQYKLLYPYTCESYQAFNHFSSGKQHALQRYQALHGLDIMRDVQCFESSCSVKEFMTWAKRYGHTPLLNLKTLNKLSTVSQAIDVEEICKKYDNTATISTELNNWLLKCQNIKPSVKQVINDSDDEIDIINIQSNVPNSFSQQRDSKTRKSNVIQLDYPKKYTSLKEFVCKSAEEVGIKLTNEEIIPGVSHSSASLLISKALECLVDELVRSALSCAIDKSVAEKNVINFKVDIDDVRKALLKREEFDIFTNAGLGSEG